MNELTPETQPETRYQVFAEQLDELCGGGPEDQHEGIFSALAELSAGALITEGTYGYGDDTEVFNMTDSIRNKLFDDSIDSTLRTRLSGMFSVLNAGAHALYKRLDETTSRELETFRIAQTMMRSEISESELSRLQALSRDGLVIRRYTGNHEDPGYCAELSSKGKAALVGYAAWVKSQADRIS